MTSYVLFVSADPGSDYFHEITETGNKNNLHFLPTSPTTSGWNKAEYWWRQRQPQGDTAGRRHFSVVVQSVFAFTGQDMGKAEPPAADRRPNRQICRRYCGAVPEEHGPGKRGTAACSGTDEPSVE